MSTHQTPSDADYEAFETAKAIAKLLAVSQRVVYLWYAKGLIPGYRIGKTVRFLKSEVLNAVRN